MNFLIYYAANWITWLCLVKYCISSLFAVIHGKITWCIQVMSERSLFSYFIFTTCIFRAVIFPLFLVSELYCKVVGVEMFYAKFYLKSWFMPSQGVWGFDLAWCRWVSCLSWCKWCLLFLGEPQHKLSEL